MYIFYICVVQPVNQCCKVIQCLQRSSWNQSWGKQKPAIYHGKFPQTLSK